MPREEGGRDIGDYPFRFLQVGPGELAGGQARPMRVDWSHTKALAGPRSLPRLPRDSHPWAPVTAGDLSSCGSADGGTRMHSCNAVRQPLSRAEGPQLNAQVGSVFTVTTVLQAGGTRLLSAQPLRGPSHVNQRELHGAHTFSVLEIKEQIWELDPSARISQLRGRDGTSEPVSAFGGLHRQGPHPALPACLRSWSAHRALPQRGPACYLGLSFYRYSIFSCDYQSEVSFLLRQQTVHLLRCFQ